MKFFDIESTPLDLAVTPLGNRLYELAAPVTRIVLVTDCGRLVFKAQKGFVTNFRSGAPVIDKFIDQVGDREKSKLYLVHDMIYTPCSSLAMAHPVSRKFGDEILRDGLAWAGMPKWKAALVYRAVRMFGHNAYHEDDALTSSNAKLFTFSWES